MIAERPEPISDGMASKLWECVSPFVVSNSASTETREVTAALGRIRFRTEEPRSPGAVSKGLMAQTGPREVIGKDERANARLLSHSQQLSTEYSDAAVELFAACRPEGPDTSLLRSAMLSISDPGQVQAMLDLYEPGARDMVPSLSEKERKVITKKVSETAGVHPRF